MSKSYNNRIMLIVLLVLAGVFVLTKVFISKRSERTLKTDLVDFDTSNVTQILIYSGQDDTEEIRFERNDRTWRVSHGEITDEAGPGSVDRLLDELLNLETDRLVTRSKDKWAEYHVDDSLGSRIVVREGKKVTLDMIVGRFTFQQPPGGQAGYGQQRGTGLTHVRLHSDDEVYTVEGFLSMTVNQPFNSWRNPLFLELNKNQISRISFDYPADSSFVLEKMENLWLAGGRQADSASTASYLNSISRKSSTSFRDNAPPTSPATFTLQIEGDNMNTVTVEAYPLTNDEYLLHSSQNPDSWFTSNREGLFGDFFKPESSFFSGLP